MPELIRYLPRFFSPDPELRPALIVTAAVPVDWSISRNVLWVGTEPIGLTDLTLGGLADRLRDAGLIVTWSDGDLLARGALVLADGGGQFLPGVTTTLTAWTSPLYALSVPVEGAMLALRDSVPSAVEQISLAGAGDAWLDRHGDLYAIPRPDAWADAEYRAHLFSEVTRPHANARGIEVTARRLFPGVAARVFEPWTQLVVFSQSALSGPDRFEDGDRWGRCLAQMQAPRADDWAGLQGVLETDRAAGIIALPARWTPAVDTFNGSGVATVRFGRTINAWDSVKDIRHPVLSASALSDYAHAAYLSFGLFRTSTLFVLGIDRGGQPAGWTGVWDARKWGDVAGVWDRPDAHATVSAGLVALLSTSVGEDYPQWTPGPHAAGDTVAFGELPELIYQASADALLSPEAEPENWTAIGVSNRHAMFDQDDATQTTDEASIAVTLQPVAGALFISAINLVGVYSVRVEIKDGDSAVYDETHNLNQNGLIATWWEYFNADPDYAANFEMALPRSDLPVTVTLNGMVGGSVSCGRLLIGFVSLLP